MLDFSLIWTCNASVWTILSILVILSSIIFFFLTCLVCNLLWRVQFYIGLILVFPKKIYWRFCLRLHRPNQYGVSQIVSNDFVGNACLNFLIIGIPLLTLHKAVSLRIFKFNFSSRYIPKCSWCEALSTGISWKNIFGWARVMFFLENITSCAGLVRSGLKSIFHLEAHFEINERSCMGNISGTVIFILGNAKYRCVICK